MEIAKTILNQIQTLDRMALIAWGTKEFVALKNGVQFKIKTPLYKKGVRVKITLNVWDTYDIEVFRVQGVEMKVLNKMENVYVDMLIETLDELIEGKQKTTILF